MFTEQNLVKHTAKEIPPEGDPQREVDPASVVTCFCFRVAHVRGLISCIDAVILCFRFRDEDPDLAW